MKQLLHHFNGQGSQTNLEPQRDASSIPPLGTINVIFATPGRAGSCSSKVMSVDWVATEGANLKPKRVKLDVQPALSFSDEDKVGTI